MFAIALNCREPTISPVPSNSCPHSFLLLASLVAEVAVFALATENIWRKYKLKREVSYDISTVAYSVIASFMMPVSVPLLVAIAGGVVLAFAKYFIEEKWDFHITNPAIFTVAVMNILFYKFMSAFSAPFYKLELFYTEAPKLYTRVLDFWNMFLGNTSGYIGSTCIPAILICAVYLFLRGKLDWEIPASYVLFCTVLGAFLWQGYRGLFIEGMVFAALFVMHDFEEERRDIKSSIIYSFACAGLTVVLYFFLNFKGAVSCSVVAVDLVVVFCNKALPVICKKFKKSASL